SLDEEEDERQVEEAEAFEASYNFRFEEEDGGIIHTYPRDVASLRQTNDKRKKERERKKQRKEEEMVQRREELKRLKNIKKEEIQQKLRMIRDIGGLDAATVSAVLDLGGDFDAKAHDEEMEKLFGEEYQQQKEQDAPLEVPASCEEFLSTAHETDITQMTKKQKRLMKMQKRRLRQAEAVEGYASDEDTQQQQQQQQQQQGEEEAATDADATATSEAAAAAEEQQQQQEGEETEPQAEWWMCDGCGKGIRGGKKRY
ncbi:krr1 family, zinc finger-containing protein, putative, partial [Eimeria acervulina]